MSSSTGGAALERSERPRAAQAVQERRADRRMVEDAVEVGAADCNDRDAAGRRDHGGIILATTNGGGAWSARSSVTSKPQDRRARARLRQAWRGRLHHRHGLRRGAGRQIREARQQDLRHVHLLERYADQVQGADQGQVRRGDSGGGREQRHGLHGEAVGAAALGATKRGSPPSAPAGSLWF